MKLFSFVKEGDRLSDAIVAFRPPEKDTNILNKKKYPFSFDIHLTTKLARIYPEIRLVTRRTLRYKAPFTFKYKKSRYLEDYSYVEYPSTGLSGFLKEKDIRRDVGICIMADTEPKSFSIKED